MGLISRVSSRTYRDAMNLNLLQKNFTQNYPDEYDGVLDIANAVVLTVTFNRRGTLLAGGCNDGKILIWDFITRGLVKTIQAHSHPIASLDWTRDGNFLISAGADNLINIWNVILGECIYSFRSSIPVLSAKWCPRVYNRSFIRRDNDESVTFPHILIMPLQAALRIVDTNNVMKKV